jgi:formylglycine-generating enzyme required for sulfatase activity
MVSWDDAKAFCQWLTKPITLFRSKLSHLPLPTDAEWSKAVGLDESSEGTPDSKNGKIKNVLENQSNAILLVANPPRG